MHAHFPRLAGLLALLISSALGPAVAEAQTKLTEREARVFQQICLTCHARPGIGVPMVGDVPEWQARRAKGLDALVAATIEGSLGMPPLGTCSFCTEDELRNLVILLADFPTEAKP